MEKQRTLQLATDCSEASHRLRISAQARGWMIDHADKWDGSGEINMRGNAMSVDGSARAMGYFEQAISDLQAAIMARAFHIAEEREREARNTIRLVADALEGRDQ